MQRTSPVKVAVVAAGVGAVEDIQGNAHRDTGTGIRCSAEAVAPGVAGGDCAAVEARG